MIQTGMEQLQLAATGNHDLKGLHDTRSYMLVVSNVKTAFKLQFRNAPDPVWYDLPDIAEAAAGSLGAHIFQFVSPSSYVRINFTADAPVAPGLVYVSISEVVSPSV